LFTSKTEALPPAEPEAGVEADSLQSGCSGTPVISSFAVSPPRIQPGQTATVSWGLVSNAKVAYLMAPGHKIGVGTPGQMTVTPDQTTTYVLQGVRGSTTSEALVTLYVDVGECQRTSRITSFTANPMTIQPGQASTLSWGLLEKTEAAVLIGAEGKKGVGTRG
jgi:hypothetical protein